MATPRRRRRKGEEYPLEDPPVEFEEPTEADLEPPAGAGRDGNVRGG